MRWFRRDRAAFVFVALALVGSLLLAGVLLAIFLPGGRKATPKTSTTAHETTTAPPPTTTAPPPTTTEAPPTTTAPPPPPPPPAGPLQAIAVGPFSATVE